MKDKDALLLWESYLESTKPDFADIDKDGDKKESMKKAAKDKEEDKETVEETSSGNLRAARTDEENEEADKDEADKKKDDDGEDVVEEEMYDCVRDYMSDGYSRAEAEKMCSGRGHEEQTKSGTLAESAMPEDDVFSAIEMAEGGDYRGAIETAVSAIANHMLNDIENTGNGPLDEAETADVWNIKDGIKLAMEDLFGGSNAEAYEALTKNLRNAFHKSNKEPEKKDLGQFFDGEPPMREVHRNHEEPNLDPYDYR